MPMPGALFLLSLLACKAEQLGVDVPRGGPESLSQEDLQRDAFPFMDPSGQGRAPGSPGGVEASQRFLSRLQQMHLLPAFGEAWELPVPDHGVVICGQKDGRSDQGVVVAALDTGAGAMGGAVPMAAIISLAKAWDVPAPPQETVILCVFPAEGGLEAYLARPAMPLDKTRAVLLVGALGGAKLAETIGSPLGDGRRAALWSTGRAPEADPLDAVDYRVVRSQVQAIYAAIAASAQGL